MTINLPVLGKVRVENLQTLRWVVDKVRVFGGSALLNLTIATVAGAFADFIDRHAITPEDLEQGIAENRAMFAAALSEIPPDELDFVRLTFGPIEKDFRRTHIDVIDGESRAWHPYKRVLRQEVLANEHRAHVEVLLRHEQWYRRQMDQALDWLFGRPLQPRDGTPAVR
jgi:hypothetical protein